jgi:large repetitive protein
MANIKRANTSGITKTGTAISDVPDAPSVSTITDQYDGASATVAATAAATGGTPTTYTITPTPTTSPATFTGTSPVTVSGLSEGTSYTFTAKGINSTATGPEGSASSSFTPFSPGSFYSIATTTLSSSTGTVTFSSIPSTYTHLQIRAIARSTFAQNTGDQVTVQVNGVTTSSYSYHYMSANGSAIGDVNATSTTTTMGLGYAPNDSVTANTFGAFIIDVADYASTSKFKTFRAFGGYDANGSGTIRLQSGLFQSTNAVTSISLTHNTFKAGSTFALYGVIA